MKLINCHIENFGAISNFDYYFSSGLNSFCEQNGYGKSTLSTFLRVMFYGLKTTTKNGAFTDRQHYYPFGGGKFGGSLTFSNDGKTYRIERFFDIKSETKDQFKLYENGSESSAFSENIGEELFGLDETSFKKTVFFGEVYEEVLATSTINARLNNVVYDMGDGGYEKALSILDKARKTYKLDKGVGGKLYEIKSKINSVKAEIEKLRAIKSSLPTKYQEIKELSLKVKELESKNQELQNKVIARTKKEHYDSLLQKAGEQKKKAGELLKEFNGKFLDDGEQIVLREVDAKLNKLNGEKKASSFSQEKNEKLVSLNSSLKDLNVEKVEYYKNVYEQTKREKKTKKPFLTSAIITFAISVLVAIILMASGVKLGFISAIIGAVLGGILAFIEVSKGKKQRETCQDKLIKVQSFLNSYGESGKEISSGFESLYSKINEFNSLLLEKKACQEKIDIIDKEIEKTSLKSQIILARYGQVEDVFSFIMKSNRAKSEYDLALKNYSDYTSEAQSFYNENNLNEQDFSSAFDEESLKQELSSLKNSLALKNKELNLLELEVERLPEQQALLDRLEDELKSAIFKHESIIKTLEILKDCQKRLNDKYVEPIKDRFLYYSLKIEKSLGEKVYMDKNYKVSFERGGEIRSDKHLSAGQKAIVDLCLRLSLIDNVFKKSSPFIVLDDSFCLLDENHFEKVKKLVNELAKETQILYFTCHACRAI